MFHNQWHNNTNLTIHCSTIGPFILPLKTKQYCIWLSFQHHNTVDYFLLLLASTNYGRIADLVIVSSKLDFLLIRLISSTIPSLYTSLVALNAIIKRFFFVEKIHIIVLNRFSLSVDTYILLLFPSICLRSCWISIAE